MKKQKWNILLIVLVTIIVAYFALKDDFSDIMKLVAQMNVWWFAFGILMVFMYWIFQTLCLSAVSASTAEKLPFMTLFKSMVICNFFSAITPSATGGQPFQIYFLNKKGIRLGAATNLVVEQSTLYQIALVLFGLIAIVLNYFFDFFPSDTILKKLVLIGFLVNLAVIMVLCYISFGKKSNKYLILKFVRFLHKIKIIRNLDKTTAKVEQTIDNFYVSAQALNSNKEALLKGIIYNFIALAFLYIVPLIVAYSFGDYHHLSVLTTLVASAYVMLIGAFVPIPGGSGGIEYAYAAFYGFYLTGSLLMASLLIWRFITYYLSILVGGLVIIIDRGGGK